MPTVKPRYTITDTGELSELLDLAQRRWPEVTERKELLIRLVQAGSEVIGSDIESRLAALRSTAGGLTGVYRPDELERLREDWPE